jgi:WD40 repeat protein
MSLTRRLVVLTLCTLALSGPGPARGQDRRKRTEPGLIVETGARMGVCDVLTFTPDGKHLLAAGDDKVVRVWPFGPAGLDSKNVQTLRWGIWRGPRGAVFAAASDRESRLVALGGYGTRTGSVVVVERATGKVRDALTDTFGNDQPIRAVTFSPSGKRVAYGSEEGGIWVWAAASGKKNEVRKVKDPERGRFNRVRLLMFEGEDRLLSATADGRVLLWDLTRAGPPAEVFRFQIPDIFRVVASADGNWLAAMGKDCRRIEVRSRDGRDGPAPVELPQGKTPRSIALDAKGQRLAVAVRTLPARGPDYFLGTDDEVSLYDLTQTPTRPARGPRSTYHAEALAFHPDGNHLAVAGGDDHEVTLWDLRDLARPVSEVRSPGSALWGVALSADGRLLGFHDKRETNPHGWNQRGKAAALRVFDLQARNFARPDNFQPVRPVETLGGWSVQTDDRLGYAWSAARGGRKQYSLPLNLERDGLPLCYTFLNPAAARRPVRLAVGQYFGVISVFELLERGPRLVRSFIGHQGEVMALAPSDKHTLLVSASRDQTIAAWKLDDWPGQSLLGARFALEGPRLLVKAVDVGSPAWEAGLSRGDEVVLFRFNAWDFLFDRDGQFDRDKKLAPFKKLFKQQGGARECLDRINRPVPGLEFYFEVKRPGQAELVKLLTNVRQRPAWQFFPTRGQEWVLWMGRTYYYDTSTNGDSFIGWHVNAPDLDQEPAFYRAEQFRQRFQRPDVIDHLVATGDVEASLRKAVVDLGPQNFGNIEPPEVTVRASAQVAKDDDTTVTVTAAPRGGNDYLQVEHAELWVNDYRLHKWQAEEGKPFRQQVKIPRAVLRRGDNELTFQAFNKAGGRAEATAKVNFPVPPAGRPSLHGLAVGIKDYSKSTPLTNGARLRDLFFTDRDARAVRDAWRRQAGKLYQSADLTLLPDGKANRETILAELDRLRQQVTSPEDRVVLFLSGHGDSPGKRDETTFVFCCPNYDRGRPSQTGITGRELYEKLADIPCRKLVLLDACHAGASINPVRSLTPGNKGPIILAACDQSQLSFEHPSIGDGHSLFTYALVEALGDQFSRADQNGDRLLDARELFAYAQGRLPELLRQAGFKASQDPIHFPLEFEPYPLAGK